MTYIQDWQRVRADSTGWPEGLSIETKRYLVNAAIRCLEVYEKEGYKPPLLYQAVDWIRRAPDLPADFKSWVTLDAIYAAVERALRTVADLRYVLDSAKAETWKRDLE